MMNIKIIIGMDDIAIEIHEDYVLILIPCTLSAYIIKKFIMRNLDLLMKNKIIWDIRRMGKVQINSNCIWCMLDLLKIFPNPNGHKKDAIVASIKEQLTPIQIMLKMLKEHDLSPVVECFGQLELAINWIREG